MKAAHHQKSHESQPQHTTKLEIKLRKISNAINVRLNRLPLHQLRTITLCFGITSATYCLLLIINPKPKTVAFPGKQTSITQPMIERQAIPAISQEDYQKLMQIKKTLDSLSNSVEGRAHINKWLRQNPGLVDSLNLLLELHQPRPLN